MKTLLTFIISAGLTVLAQAEIVQNPGAVLEVPSQYPTIQAALDAASPGDEVRVSSGTYSPSTNKESFPIFLRDGVALIGSTPETTILDAEGTGRVVNALNLADERSRIDGFTIRGGNVEKASAEENGGGGIFSDNSALVISNNIIEGNIAIHGGGILARGQRAPVMAGNHILENQIPFAGFGAAVLIDSCRAEMVNNIVTRNTSGRGSLTVINSAPLIINNTFYGNLEKGSYSVGVHLTANADPLLANNIFAGFKDNAVVEEDVDSDPVLRNNLFDNNGADYLDESKNSYSGPSLETQIVNGQNEVQENVFGPAGFVDPDQDDFRLTSVSAAIDEGDPSVNGLPPVDIQGSQRALGPDGAPGVVDIGAYEYSPPRPEVSQTTERTTYEVVSEEPVTTTVYTEEPVTTVIERRYYYYTGPRYVYSHYYVDYPYYSYYYDWWPDYYYVSVWWPHRTWCYYPYFYYNHHHHDRDYDHHRDWDNDGRDHGGHDGRDDGGRPGGRDDGGRPGGRDDGGRDGSADDNPRTGTPMARNFTSAGTRDDAQRAVAERNTQTNERAAASPRTGTGLATERNASNPAGTTRTDDPRGGSFTSGRRGSPDTGSSSDRSTTPSRNEVVTTTPRVDMSRSVSGRRESPSVDTSTPVESRVSRSYPAPVRRVEDTPSSPSGRSDGGFTTVRTPSRNEVVSSSSRRDTPSPIVYTRDTGTPRTTETWRESSPPSNNTPTRRVIEVPQSTERRSSSVESVAPRSYSPPVSVSREAPRSPVTVVPQRSVPSSPPMSESRRSFSPPASVPRPSQSYSPPPVAPRMESVAPSAPVERGGGGGGGESRGRSFGGGGGRR